MRMVILRLAAGLVALPLALLAGVADGAQPLPVAANRGGAGGEEIAVPSSSASLELLRAVPAAVSTVAGADDALAVLRAVRAMPLLSVARRFGFLKATESAWEKLDAKLALPGGADRVLLSGPVVVSTAPEGHEGFVLLAGVTAEAAELLRGKLEAVPTELVEGRPILTIERGSMRLAIVDRPAWLTATMRRQPFIVVLAPPEGRGPEMLRASVRLLSGEGNAPAVSGTAMSISAIRTGRPIGAGKQAWLISQGGAPAGDERTPAFACGLAISGKSLLLRASVASAARAAGEAELPDWVRDRPRLAEPALSEVGLLVEQVDPAALAALPAPLNWLTVGTPMPADTAGFLAVRQVTTTGAEAARATYAADSMWIDTTARTEKAEARADAVMAETVRRLEQLGKAEAARAGAPVTELPTFAPGSLRQVRLRLDPATLVARLAGSRPELTWRAGVLPGAGQTMINGRLAPAAVSAGVNRGEPAAAAWTHTPLPAPPTGTETQNTGPAADVIAQGLLRPGVMAGILDQPGGQAAMADILRSVELLSWRITRETPTGVLLEVELRQASPPGQ